MKHLTLTVALGSVLVLGACGDDGADDAGQEPPALTRAQFVKQANAICARSGKELRKAARRDGIDTRAELSSFLLGTGSDLLHETYDQLGELVPPAEIADDVEAMLDDADTALETIEAQPARVLDDSLFAATKKKARALGLAECD